MVIIQCGVWSSYRGFRETWDYLTAVEMEKVLE